MKMTKMQMKINPDPKMDSSAVLDIFDIVEEYTDWDGEVVGFGPTAITTFLQEHPGVTEITVRINSQGGSVFDGVSVCNLLSSSGAKIVAEVIGLAGSIASVIACSADTVRMYPSSMMMVHNCWTWARGNANDLRKLADDMDKIMESSKAIYLAKAGDKLTTDKLQELLDGETYLTAAECKVYGFCDEIIGEEPEDLPPLGDEPTPSEKVDFEPNQAKKTWFF